MYKDSNKSPKNSIVGKIKKLTNKKQPIPSTSPSPLGRGGQGVR